MRAAVGGAGGDGAGVVWAGLGLRTIEQVVPLLLLLLLSL